MEQLAQWWNGRIFPADASRRLWLYRDGDRWRVEWQVGYDERLGEDYDSEQAARERIEVLMDGDNGWRELVPPKDEAAPQPGG